jgi:hypothetical protein
MRKPLELRTISGPSVAAGGVRVTAESRVLEARLPFGGFRWCWPSAVVVERKGQIEQRQRLRVVDMTRLLQLALWTCALVAWLVGQRRAQRRENAT